MVRFHFFLAALLAALLALPGCGAKAPTLPSDRPMSRQPVMRVRIARNKPSVRIGAGRLRVRALGGGSGRSFESPLTIRHRPGRFELEPRRGKAITWSTSVLRIEEEGIARAGTSDHASEGRGIRIDGASFPGRLQIHLQAGGLDVVNEVPMENYLPGVLEGELYSHWGFETFAAQTIAARTYALHRAMRSKGRHYDVESTTASQVYLGTTRNRQALEAVRRTRGMVLTWQDRIFPAYYSSTCGGTGQDAHLAFTDSPDIPPLHGRRHGGWCAASGHYRWGPLRRDRIDLGRRLASWGSANAHPIAAVRSVDRVVVVSRNSSGRPTTFAVSNTSGQTFRIQAESFRFACNHGGSGLPAVEKAAVLKSAHVNVAVNGKSVWFRDGRGHGHGVGLCQWGTQSMASKGHNAASILNFYYPGAKVKRLY